MNQLLGKVSVVTGASEGIGYATTVRFLKEGSTVIMISRKEGTGKQKAEALAREYPGKVFYYDADIRDRARIAEIYADVYEKHGKINVLVANAGDQRGTGMPDEETEELQQISREIIETDVIGTNNCCAEMVKYFRLSGGGSIVVVSSIANEFSWMGDWAYQAAKAANFNTSKVYATNYGKDKIRSNCVMPSNTKTKGALSYFVENNLPWMEPLNPLGVSVSADDIANTILFFAGDDARAITGQFIVVDGGLTVNMPDCVESNQV